MRILLNLTAYQCLIGWIKLPSVMFFKMHNNLAPKYMSEHFSPARNAHSHKTRFGVSVNQGKFWEKDVCILRMLPLEFVASNCKKL